MNSPLQQAMAENVRQALAEDIGSGDITAELIPDNSHGEARVIIRDQAIICGQPWVNEVFRQISPKIRIGWRVKEGERVQADTTLFHISGPAQAMLTGERAALNFLQLLSGTATCCNVYAKHVEGTGVKLLDTRKTIPGLRLAQKYAVRVGGCHNHRKGLYDAFLIKENHIAACGSISSAVSSARKLAPDKPVEVEVESLDELILALECGTDIIMLDNFSLFDLHQAVELNRKRYAGTAQLEASGGITFTTLRPVAETGVDYISIGALTKSCRAIDLSMRFTRM